MLAFQSKDGFFLLPILLLTSIVTIFLLISWRTIVYYEEICMMREEYQEVHSAAQALGMWSVALARQHFDLFMQYKNKPFTCSMAHWPAHEHGSSMKGEIEIQADDNGLHIQSCLIKNNGRISLCYTLAKESDEAGNDVMHVQRIG